MNDLQILHDRALTVFYGKNQRCRSTGLNLARLRFEINLKGRIRSGRIRRICFADNRIRGICVVNALANLPRHYMPLKRCQVLKLIKRFPKSFSFS